jgi:hypothetical protein
MKSEILGDRHFPAATGGRGVGRSPERRLTSRLAPAAPGLVNACPSCLVDAALNR